MTDIKILEAVIAALSIENTELMNALRPFANVMRKRGSVTGDDLQRADQVYHQHHKCYDLEPWRAWQNVQDNN